MSRIGDDSNEERRIQDLQEAQLRQKLDTEKRDAESRAKKSFAEVIADKTRREGAKDSDRRAMERGAKKPSDPKKDARPERAAGSMDRQRLLRNAAMGRMAAHSMKRTRAADAEELRSATTDRVEQADARARDEKDAVERDVRDADDREVAAFDQRVAEQRSSPNDAPIERDTREKRRDRDTDGREGRDDGPTVAGVQAESRTLRTAIPRELIEKLVEKIYRAATTDGRTSLRIELKGTMLDGIRLTVVAHDGKVRCTFEGCSRELGKLLESSRGVLAKCLSSRGLALEALQVT